MKINKLDLGKRILKARKTKKMSQEAVASILGIKQATLSRWEKGGEPPARGLFGFSRICEIDYIELLTGKSEEKPEEDLVSEPLPGYGIPSLTKRQTELLDLDSKADKETRKYIRYLLQRAQPREIKRRQVNKHRNKERRSGDERRKEATV